MQGDHSVIPLQEYVSSQKGVKEITEADMKQTLNLAVGTVLSGTEYWSPVSRSLPAFISPFILRVGSLGMILGSRLYTILGVLLLTGIFIAGSYLFLVQLAAHGW